MKNLKIEAIVIAAGIAVGLLLLGLMVKWAVGDYKDRERVIEVRGLAEREVKADMVTWSIVYKEPGNDPEQLLSAMERKNSEIMKFLKENGISESEIFTSAPEVSDQESNEYYSNDKYKYRYHATTKITVISKEVDKVRDMLSRQTELMRMGIVLVNNGYMSPVQYDFTQLNSIKPAMIEEATKNARAAADKFAEDSGSDIGKIKTASQGYFEVSDVDESTPYLKNVRVVTNVEYYINN